MTAVTVSSPADHGCESPAAVSPLAFGLAGFFLPQRLRRAFHSGAALPGLYSWSFYSARSVRKAMGPLESPKSENPLRKQRAF